MTQTAVDHAHAAKNYDGPDTQKSSIVGTSCRWRTKKLALKHVELKV